MADGRSTNPLHDLIAAGKMPVILELHLTEGDREAYQTLRQRHIARGYELPHLTVLGQYLRQAESASEEYSPAERSLIRKLQVYADLVSSGGVDLLALDDGSRGRDTLDNAIAAALLIGLGADPSRLMANVVARNRQADHIRRRLLHFSELGLRNVLLLTGDLPLGTARPARFPLDSIGMCHLARRMLIEGALPEDFWIAAAGHPNPDADPDGLHTLHKALAGAKVIITQAIYSMESFSDWMNKLQQIGVLDQVHVLGEVIPITSAEQLRLIAEVPGMRVPRELINGLDVAHERIKQEAGAGGHSPDWVRQRLRSEGARVTRDLLHRIRRVPGVSGFYLGCVKGFEAHLELLREAPLLPEPGRSLPKGIKISGALRQRVLAEVPSLEAAVHRLIHEADRRRKRSRRWSRLEHRRWFQMIWKVLEWPKGPVFGCKQCDQCDLSPDALICPRGCAKQMTHGPCGAPRRVGSRMLCEDTSRECTWTTIRGRRQQYGLPLGERLEIREAPSPGFYAGETYSAFIPVLSGRKKGPNWSLLWRVPWALMTGELKKGVKHQSTGDPRELATLAAAHSEYLLSLLVERPDLEPEELFIKLLALIGTPAAWWLVEARLAEFGLPAEGTVADLSLREQFQVAEALPRIRRKVSDPQRSGHEMSSMGVPEEFLALLPEGRRLRQALRRERANGLMAHAAALGVNVGFAESMLDAKHVDDFLTALTILKDELQLAKARLPFDAGRLSVYFHRVHYKHHFHPAIAVHPFVEQGGAGSARAAIRVDMRQYQSAANFRHNLREALETLAGRSESLQAPVRMEDFGPGRQSLCWQFNLEFWKRLREFERATGKNYDASIGGSTDHNLSYARSAARALFDKLHGHHVDDSNLYILEIGVASTHRARTFLSEFRRICELTGTNDYHRMTYLLADCSEALLTSSAAELSRSHQRVETVKIDAGDPHAALSRYRGRILHAHLCNVYDSLPCDQALWLDDQWYRIETRAYVPAQAFREITTRHGFTPDDGRVIATRLDSAQNRDGVNLMVARFLDWAKDRLAELGRPIDAYISFWMDLFAAIRLDERYVAVADGNELLPGGLGGIDRPGDILQRHIAGASSARIHLNQAALAGFAQLLPILHPHGTLEVVDLFVQRLEEYEHTFKGPAKYDGSMVNWLNGPLFRAVGEQMGYSVRFQPFRPFDPKSPSVVLLANPIDNRQATIDNSRG